MLNLHNVSINFGQSPGLKKINLSVSKGDYLYIIGPTGAGKTTLLRSMYFDVPLKKGHITFEHFNSLSLKPNQIASVRRRMGIVFQDFKLLSDRNVFENITYALRATGSSSRNAKRKTIKALTSVGMLTKRNSEIGELSGGELQRVSIARAISNDPLVIFADEPTGNLDPETAREIFMLLQTLNRRGIAIVVATHNYKLIELFPGKVIALDLGTMVKKT